MRWISSLIMGGLIAVIILGWIAVIHDGDVSAAANQAWGWILNVWEWTKNIFSSLVEWMTSSDWFQRFFVN